MKNKKSFIEKSEAGKLKETIFVEKTRNLATSSEDIFKIYQVAQKTSGKGSYGSIRTAHLIKNTDQVYAIKTILIDEVFKYQQFIVKELDILRSVDHPNIANFYECYLEHDKVHFVLEYCSGSTVMQSLKREEYFIEEKAQKIIFETLLAVNHLHAKGICHRDIKLENVLFENELESSSIKIIDFGLSVKFDKKKKMTEKVGTPYYVAPELLNGYYDQRIDIWSCGVMLYLMLAG